jgi:hypothetical protein
MPIGDPHGFGKKNEPLSILAGGAALIEGLAASEVALTFTSGLMIASGALSIIGSITGNKTLSTIGSIASIGSLGMNMWDKMAGKAGTLVTEGSQAGTVAETGTGIVNADSAAQATNLLSKGSVLPEASLNMADITKQVTGNQVANLADSATGGLVPEVGATPGAVAPELTNNVPGGPNTPTTSKPGLLSKTGAFFKDNKELINIAGKGIEAMFPGAKTQADIDYLQSLIKKAQIEGHSQQEATRIAQEQWAMQKQRDANRDYVPSMAGLSVNAGMANTNVNNMAAASAPITVGA